MVKLNKILWIILSILIGCAAHKVETVNTHGLEITEVSPDKQTAITKQNLYHLAQVYELEPFLFAKKIRINAIEEPGPSNILTVHTRYANQPNKLLSQWLHAELHFWARLNAKKMAAAIQELKTLYPNPSLESKPGDNYSIFPHLIICFLEFEALAYFLGKNQAISIITDFMKDDKILPWTYSQVLTNSDPIRKIIEKYELMPAPLI
ncbi:MAG TPA: hypothetical protein VNJ08_05140 [Bacteriovoracaceae bacterium]|nr:hypothetical protein [Bacteriovoracaceae bacterium]